MPVQRQFMFYPRTQCDWINSRGHTCKNTTHQNIIMHYPEFIFLKCTVGMPPTLPLTFRCLTKLQFPLTRWWKNGLLMSSCIIHLTFCLQQKKPVGILINYNLAVTKAVCFFMYRTIRLGLKLSLFQQFLIKVKHQQIKWYRRLCIQYHEIKSMLGNVNRL